MRQDISKNKDGYYTFKDKKGHYPENTSIEYYDGDQLVAEIENNEGNIRIKGYCSEQLTFVGLSNSVAIEALGHVCIAKNSKIQNLSVIAENILINDAITANCISLEGKNEVAIQGKIESANELRIIGNNLQQQAAIDSNGMAKIYAKLYQQLAEANFRGPTEFTAMSCKSSDSLKLEQCCSMTVTSLEVTADGDVSVIKGSEITSHVNLGNVSINEGGSLELSGFEAIVEQDGHYIAAEADDEINKVVTARIDSVEFQGQFSMDQTICLIQNRCIQSGSNSSLKANHSQIMMMNNSMFDVSSYENNCGLYAMAVAINCALAQCDEEFRYELEQHLPSSILTLDPKLLSSSSIDPILESLGSELRQELVTAFLANDEYKNNQLQHFVSLLALPIEQRSVDTLPLLMANKAFIDFVDSQENMGPDELQGVVQHHWQDLYYTYVCYLADNPVYLTADELAQLAILWHVNLEIKFDERRFNYNSEGHLITIRLTNPTQKHWMVDLNADHPLVNRQFTLSDGKVSLDDSSCVGKDLYLDNVQARLTNAALRATRYLSIDADVQAENGSALISDGDLDVCGHQSYFDRTHIKAGDTLELSGDSVFQSNCRIRFHRLETDGKQHVHNSLITSLSDEDYNNCFVDGELDKHATLEIIKGDRQHVLNGELLLNNTCVMLNGSVVTVEDSSQTMEGESGFFCAQSITSRGNLTLEPIYENEDECRDETVAMVGCDVDHDQVDTGVAEGKNVRFSELNELRIFSSQKIKSEKKKERILTHSFRQSDGSCKADGVVIYAETDLSAYDCEMVAEDSIFQSNSVSLVCNLRDSHSVFVDTEYFNHQQQINELRKQLIRLEEADGNNESRNHKKERLIEQIEEHHCSNAEISFHLNEGSFLVGTRVIGRTLTCFDVFDIKSGFIHVDEMINLNGTASLVKTHVKSKKLCIANQATIEDSHLFAKEVMVCGLGSEVSFKQSYINSPKVAWLGLIYLIGDMAGSILQKTQQFITGRHSYIDGDMFLACADLVTLNGKSKIEQLILQGRVFVNNSSQYARSGVALRFDDSVQNNSLITADKQISISTAHWYGLGILDATHIQLLYLSGILGLCYCKTSVIMDCLTSVIPTGLVLQRPWSRDGAWDRWAILNNLLKGAKAVTLAIVNNKLITLYQTIMLMRELNSFISHRLRNGIKSIDDSDEDYQQVKNYLDEFSLWPTEAIETWNRPIPYRALLNVTCTILANGRDKQSLDPGLVDLIEDYRDSQLDETKSFDIHKKMMLLHRATDFIIKMRSTYTSLSGLRSSSKPETPVTQDNLPSIEIDGVDMLNTWDYKDLIHLITIGDTDPATAHEGALAYLWNFRSKLVKVHKQHIHDISTDDDTVKTKSAITWNSWSDHYYQRMKEMPYEHAKTLIHEFLPQHVTKGIFDSSSLYLVPSRQAQSAIYLNLGGYQGIDDVYSGCYANIRAQENLNLAVHTLYYNQIAYHEIVGGRHVDAVFDIHNNDVGAGGAITDISYWGKIENHGDVFSSGSSVTQTAYGNIETQRDGSIDAAINLSVLSRHGKVINKGDIQAQDAAILSAAGGIQNYNKIDASGVITRLNEASSRLTDEPLIENYGSITASKYTDMQGSVVNHVGASLTQRGGKRYGNSFNNYGTQEIGNISSKYELEHWGERGKTNVVNDTVIESDDFNHQDETSIAETAGVQTINNSFTDMGSWKGGTLNIITRKLSALSGTADVNSFSIQVDEIPQTLADILFGVEYETVDPIYVPELRERAVSILSEIAYAKDRSSKCNHQINQGRDVGRFRIEKSMWDTKIEDLQAEFEQLKIRAEVDTDVPYKASNSFCVFDKSKQLTYDHTMLARWHAAHLGVTFGFMGHSIEMPSNYNDVTAGLVISVYAPLTVNELNVRSYHLASDKGLTFNGCRCSALENGHIGSSEGPVHVNGLVSAQHTLTIFQDDQTQLFDLGNSGKVAAATISAQTGHVVGEGAVGITSLENSHWKATSLNLNAKVIREEWRDKMDVKHEGYWYNKSLHNLNRAIGGREVKFIVKVLSPSVLSEHGVFTWDLDNDSVVVSTKIQNLKMVGKGNLVYGSVTGEQGVRRRYILNMFKGANKKSFFSVRSDGIGYLHLEAGKGKLLDVSQLTVRRSDEDADDKSDDPLQHTLILKAPGGTVKTGGSIIEYNQSEYGATLKLFINGFDVFNILDHAGRALYGALGQHSNWSNNEVLTEILDTLCRQEPLIDSIRQLVGSENLIEKLANGFNTAIDAVNFYVDMAERLNTTTLAKAFAARMGWDFKRVNIRVVTSIGKRKICEQIIDPNAGISQQYIYIEADEWYLEGGYVEADVTKLNVNKIVADPLELHSSDKSLHLDVSGSVTLEKNVPPKFAASAAAGKEKKKQTNNENPAMRFGYLDAGNIDSITGSPQIYLGEAKGSINYLSLQSLLNTGKESDWSAGGGYDFMSGSPAIKGSRGSGRSQTVSPGSLSIFRLEKGTAFRIGEAELWGAALIAPDTPIGQVIAHSLETFDRYNKFGISINTAESSDLIQTIPVSIKHRDKRGVVKSIAIVPIGTPIEGEAITEIDADKSFLSQMEKNTRDRRFNFTIKVPYAFRKKIDEERDAFKRLSATDQHDNSGANDPRENLRIFDQLSEAQKSALIGQPFSQQLYDMDPDYHDSVIRKISNGEQAYQAGQRQALQDMTRFASRFSQTASEIVSRDVPLLLWDTALMCIPRAKDDRFAHHRNGFDANAEHGFAAMLRQSQKRTEECVENALQFLLALHRTSNDLNTIIADTLLAHLGVTALNSAADQAASRMRQREQVLRNGLHLFAQLPVDQKIDFFADLSAHLAVQQVFAGVVLPRTLQGIQYLGDSLRLKRISFPKIGDVPYKMYLAKGVPFAANTRRAMKVTSANVKKALRGNLGELNVKFVEQLRSSARQLTNSKNAIIAHEFATGEVVTFLLHENRVVPIFIDTEHAVGTINALQAGSSWQMGMNVSPKARQPKPTSQSYKDAIDVPVTVVPEPTKAAAPTATKMAAMVVRDNPSRLRPAYPSFIYNGGLDRPFFKPEFVTVADLRNVESVRIHNNDHPLRFVYAILENGQLQIAKSESKLNPIYAWNQQSLKNDLLYCFESNNLQLIKGEHLQLASSRKTPHKYYYYHPETQLPVYEFVLLQPVDITNGQPLLCGGEFVVKDGRLDSSSHTPLRGINAQCFGYHIYGEHLPKLVETAFIEAGVTEAAGAFSDSRSYYQRGSMSFYRPPAPMPDLYGKNPANFNPSSSSFLKKMKSAAKAAFKDSIPHSRLPESVVPKIAATEATLTHNHTKIHDLATELLRSKKSAFDIVDSHHQELLVHSEGGFNLFSDSSNSQHRLGGALYRMTKQRNMIHPAINMLYDMAQRLNSNGQLKIYGFDLLKLDSNRLAIARYNTDHTYDVLVSTGRNIQLEFDLTHELSHVVLELGMSSELELLSPIAQRHVQPLRSAFCEDYWGYNHARSAGRLSTLELQVAKEIFGMPHDKSYLQNQQMGERISYFAKMLHQYPKETQKLAPRFTKQFEAYVNETHAFASQDSIFCARLILDKKTKHPVASLMTVSSSNESVHFSSLSPTSQQQSPERFLHATVNGFKLAAENEAALNMMQEMLQFIKRRHSFHPTIDTLMRLGRHHTQIGRACIFAFDKPCIESTAVDGLGSAAQTLIHRYSQLCELLLSTQSADGMKSLITQFVHEFGHTLPMGNPWLTRSRGRSMIDCSDHLVDKYKTLLRRAIAHDYWHHYRPLRERGLRPGLVQDMAFWIFRHAAQYPSGQQLAERFCYLLQSFAVAANHLQSTVAPNAAAVVTAYIEELAATYPFLLSGNHVRVTRSLIVHNPELPMIRGVSALADELGLPSKNLLQMLKKATVDYLQSDLRGATVYHGTTSDAVPSVVQGPRNIKLTPDLAGPGLYLTRESERNMARLYAIHHAVTRGQQVDSSRVLVGRLNPGKQLRIARIELVMVNRLIDLLLGEFPEKWTIYHPALLAFIQEHFDGLEFVNARSNGISVNSDNFLVLYERAGADAVLWKTASPAWSEHASLFSLAQLHRQGGKAFEASTSHHAESSTYGRLFDQQAEKRDEWLQVDVYSAPCRQNAG